MYKAIIAALGLIVASGPVLATVIDFEDLAVPPFMDILSGDQVSRGFAFDSNVDHTHLANRVYDANSGSTFLMSHGLAGTGSLTMTKLGGALFSLSSIQLGEVLNGGNASEVTVTGTVFGGGTVTRALTLDGVLSNGVTNNFETFVFDAGWTNLTQVSFAASAGVLPAYWAVDDIVVGAPPPPPPGAIIDFEDIAVPPGTLTTDGDLLSRGFRLDQVSDHTHRGNDVYAANSLSTFVVIDGLPGAERLVLSRADGELFSLASIELSELIIPGASAEIVTLTGLLGSGAVVTDLVTLDGVLTGGAANNFQKHLFDSRWTDLVSLTVDVAAGTLPRYLAIDNIATAAPAVDEVLAPATIVLLGLGLASLAAARRHAVRSAG